MAFQAGAWNQLPTNCTRDITLTFSRCAEWGTQAIVSCVDWVKDVTLTCIQWAWEAVQTCIDWATNVAQECTSWATQTSQSCCDWWPCDWGCDIITVIVSWVCAVFATVVTTVCVAFGVVVTAVCAAFAILVTVLCALYALLVYVFCLVWSVISIILCLSNADGGTAFLMTDGTVMMQECASVYWSGALGTKRWWKLTPNSSGSYLNGTWSRLADANVARKYFASGVLADGRLVVCGGEYSDASDTEGGDDTATCEIYDPVADKWTPFSPPDINLQGHWDKIGDAPCAVLPDGTFLMGAIDTPDVARLDPSSLNWTEKKNRPGVGSSSEESWVLMPADTVAAPSCSNPPTTWVYDVTNDVWNQGDKLLNSIVLPPPGDVAEIGPALLRYDGTAFFIGGNQHTAVYMPGGKPEWSNGPDLPMQNNGNIGTMDGPAALLVNGNILFGAAPIDAKGDYESPDFYFEFDGTTFNRTSDPPNSNCQTYVTRLLLLPNGDVMFCREDDSSFYAYHPASASPQDSYRPTIQSVPAMIVAGTTVQISGTQFNGLSQAVAYGDDSQAATNYPLVRVTNKSSGNVFYCRTFNHTTVDQSGNTTPSMGVATGAAVITTNVQFSAELPAGDYSLEVVANGIPSMPAAITIQRNPVRPPHGR